MSKKWRLEVIERLTKLEVIFTNHLEHHKKHEGNNFKLYCIILAAILGVVFKVYFE